MQYKQIKVNTLINKITKKDTLFAGIYTIDPYQNCEYGCLYCDSSIDKTIYIKTNAIELLRKELIHLNQGTIIVGSVHDPYQKVEEQTKITRALLKIIEESNFACHILTKSDLVLRDIEILSKIKKCRVTLSLTSVNNYTSKIFEINVPLPKTRLQTIKRLSEAGIKAGLAQIPILPYVTDEEINEIIKSAKNYKASYFLYKHLELKGDQKLCYFNVLKNYYPTLIEKYQKLYNNSYLPDIRYVFRIKNNINKLCNIYGLENKILK